MLQVTCGWHIRRVLYEQVKPREDAKPRRIQDIPPQQNVTSKMPWMRNSDQRHLVKKKKKTHKLFREKALN